MMYLLVRMKLPVRFPLILSLWATDCRIAVLYIRYQGNISTFYVVLGLMLLRRSGTGRIAVPVGGGGGDWTSVYSQDGSQHSDMG